jgi:dTDP-4-dehydrorhamnose reductase
MKSTVIIGFGHLGRFIDPSWTNNLQIHAITRTQPKVEFKNLNWLQHQITSSNVLENKQNLVSVIKTSPWINFWLPPSLYDHSKNIYLDVLKNVISLLNREQLLTFISSTSIFGSKSRNIFENTSPDPESDNAKLLVTAENYIRSHHPRHHIIRPAGLVDNFRHPIHSLAGRKELKEGNNLVNLVHSQDVVNFIWHLQKFFSKASISTNIASHTHLSREIFYTRSAKLRSLSMPEFLTQNEAAISHRRVASHHLWQIYRYQLNYLHVD